MAGKSDEFFGNHRGDDYWLNGRMRWAQGAQEMARIFADVDLMLVPSLRDEILTCEPLAKLPSRPSIPLKKQ